MFPSALIAVLLRQNITLLSLDTHQGGYVGSPLGHTGPPPQASTTAPFLCSTAPKFKVMREVLLILLIENGTCVRLNPGQ